MAQIRWFHAIELRPGLVTPAREQTAKRLDLLRIPPDLSGCTVLDTGAWDGFFSFEAERRGAARVVAADPGQQLDWDPTKWWGPSPAAVKEMLHDAGFARVEQVTPASWAYKAARTARRSVHDAASAGRHRIRPPRTIDQGRAVFRAFK